MILTTENFELSAAKVYRKAKCISTEAFLFDLNNVDLNADVTRYKNNKDPRTIRIIINKIITAYNLFGPDVADFIIFKSKDDKRDTLAQILNVLNLYIGDFKFDNELQKEIENAIGQRTT